MTDKTEPQMKSRCLTITYLTKASYTSLNGSDKESDNIVSIKKIQMNDGKEYPYCSSQAVRRALREQLATMGWKLSKVSAGDVSSTACDPTQYIDDDLFGYMKADTQTKKRTSPVRVSPLIALEPYRGELDYATNLMGVKDGGNPNPFETEIHSGFYRGSILIELDRVGCDEGFNETPLTPQYKVKRIHALLDSIQNLWTVGRQTRFLTDCSPKFMAAALLKVKNPIFLECIKVKDNKMNKNLLDTTKKDYESMISYSCFGERKGFFDADTTDFKSIGDSFSEIKKWITEELFTELETSQQQAATN